MGDDFLVQKLPSCLFLCLTIIYVLRRLLTLFFPLCFPFKLRWFLCYGLFSTVAFYAYFFSSFTAYLSFNFPSYFPEKSENICLFFRHVSVNIQWILFVIIFFVELSFELSNLYSFIYSDLYIRLLFKYRHSFIHLHTYWFSSLSHLFEPFSYSYLFIYLFVICSFIYSLFLRLTFWAVQLFYYLFISYPLFLLNCANSVYFLCAV